MEVEKISAVGGVRPQQSPLWPRTQPRRRHFTEEVDDPAGESESGNDAGGEHPEQSTAHASAARPGQEDLEQEDGARGRIFDALA